MAAKKKRTAKTGARKVAKKKAARKAAQASRTTGSRKSDSDDVVYSDIRHAMRAALARRLR